MTHTKRLFIRGLTTLSALGSERGEIRESLERNEPRAATDTSGAPVFPLAPSAAELVEYERRISDYRKLDPVTLSALAAARKTFGAVAPLLDEVCGVSIGSSRGPTHLLEHTMELFARSPEGVLPPETSPVTTAGNISGWVGQLLFDYVESSSSTEVRERAASELVTLGTSMTCSSAFQSLVVGLAMIRAGFGESFVFGGAEACLTPYTIAQLRALRLYSRRSSSFPCRPCARSEKRENSVTLGEAAGVALLTTRDDELGADDLELVGTGWATEAIPSATGMSTDGRLFAASMERALAEVGSGAEVGGVIVHCPGSAQGDRAELEAVKRVFPSGIPMWSSKYLSGHSYGASGLVSLAAAREALAGTPLRPPVYDNVMREMVLTPHQVVLVNTAGFGGTAVTLAVTRACA